MGWAVVVTLMLLIAHAFCADVRDSMDAQAEQQLLSRSSRTAEAPDAVGTWECVVARPAAGQALTGSNKAHPEAFAHVAAAAEQLRQIPGMRVSAT